MKSVVVSPAKYSGVRRVVTKKVSVGIQSGDGCGFQSSGQAASGFPARWCMDNDLGNHRIKLGADLAPSLNA